MLKKASPKNDVVDVRADEPERAMGQFTDGLRRVLSAQKPHKQRVKRRKKRSR